MSNLVEQLRVGLQLPKLRSFRSFAEPKDFKLPAVRELQGRIGDNLFYWRSNYVVIAVAVLALTIYMNPWMLLGLLLGVGASAYLLLLHKGDLDIGTVINIPRSKFAYLCVAAVALGLLVTGAYAMMYYSVVMAIVVLAHAAMRTRPIAAKAASLMHSARAVMSGDADDEPSGHRHGPPSVGSDGTMTP